MDDRTRDLLAQADAAKQEATAPAQEVLDQVYRAILAVPFISPEVGDDGTARCGFDVLLGDGTHLEFLVTNTGWGKALAPALGPLSRRLAPRGR